ncbi:MAG: M23 family metallopeptidase [Ignavibacteria bacterium]
MKNTNLNISIIFFVIFFLLLVLRSNSLNAQNKNSNDSLFLNNSHNTIDDEHSYNPAKRWNEIVDRIRDTSYKKNEAIDSLRNFFDELNEFIRKNYPAVYGFNCWVFPVKGYTASAIGGNNGSGYIVGDFDFFIPNSGIHPAHDIFISDKNQDNIDDKTGKPVEILSMSGGIVVETRTNWTPQMMDIRGGNVVYVYDNYSDGLFYYAHLDKVFVKVGDFVEPGQVLGTMGRTGKNAYPSRSPTHLHIMYLKNVDGDLIPEDIYKSLLKAKTISDDAKKGK